MALTDRNDEETRSTQPLVNSAEFEVATAADFGDWQTAVRNEARTLFFLAAWRRTVRATRGGLPPLHLVCIGEPPDTVRWLAERTGARLTIHPAVAGEEARFPFDRWYGLRLPTPNGRLLLLGNETLVLRTPVETFRGMTGEVFAAAFSRRKNIPGAWWKAAYRLFELASPAQVEGMVDGTGETAAKTKAWPSYDPGVIFTSDPEQLRAVWSEHFQRIVAALPEWQVQMSEVREPITTGGHLAFATAAAALGERGVHCQRLLPRDNARLLRFQAGTVNFRTARLLNLPDFCERILELSQVREFIASQAEAWRVALVDHCDREGGGWWARRQAARQARCLGNLLEELYRTEVRPAFLACGVYG